MLTRSQAHALACGHRTPEGLLALARALGFAGPTAVMARALVSTVRADAPHSSPTCVLRDRGHAAFCVDRVPAGDWRRHVARIAGVLDRVADARRWLLIAGVEDGTLVVAAWLSHPRGPRMAVLAMPPDRVTDSDVQTLCALADAWADDPTLTCLRWHDLLGRSAIGARFYRAIEGHVTALADSWPTSVRGEDRRTLALVHVARLLFLKFLETKGWLDGHQDFLAREVHAAVRAGKPLATHLLAPLVFGTLNTPPAQRAARARTFGRVPFLNGGLFAVTALERRARTARPPDDELARLILDTLTRYRFTAREDAESWTEAAIDPDMLGRAFEGLMHPDTRRGTGAFYTPAALVHTLVRDALDALAGGDATLRAAMAGPRTASGESTEACDRARHVISHWRVLDPACGSGSMLVAVLEHLTELLGNLGDERAPHLRRRELLCRNIFGVDRTPMAVWLCELRLWLSVVIDDPAATPGSVRPLPNLDHNIRVGDALAGGAFEVVRAATSLRLTVLRERYVRSSGARKRVALRTLDLAVRTHAVQVESARIDALSARRRDLLAQARSRTLFGARTGLTSGERTELLALRRTLHARRARRRSLSDGAALPFDFSTHFPDAAGAGGFDLVIGNPPWVRPHHLDPAARADVRVHTPTPDARTRPFGVQPDLAMAFTARALSLTRPRGALAFVVPTKLWCTTAGAGLRAQLLRETTLHALRDRTHDAGGFAAAVYPSLLTLTRGAPMPVTRGDGHELRAEAADTSGTLQQWTMPATALPLDAQSGAPWRIVPPPVRHAANLLARAGHPWTESALPSPVLGVKTGHNDGFLVNGSEADAALSRWVRPVIRGDAVRAWSLTAGALGMVVPFTDRGVLRTLPGALARHFGPHEAALRARSDLRPRDPWWTLFRTELLGVVDWRVIWADIGLQMRAALLPPDSPLVPLNTCYGVRCHDAIDALALTALLNAPTTTAWLSLVAEPARGGYRRFMSWTVMQLPLPPWDRARRLLAPLAARARRGESVTAEELHDRTLSAYGIAATELVPLLAWTGQQLRAARAPVRHAS